MPFKRMSLFQGLLLLAGVVLAALPVQGQVPDSATPAPFLATITPCGGKRGTTVEVTFAGSDLEEPKALLFDHPGLVATPVVVPAPPPMAGKPPVPAPPVTKFQVKIAGDVPVGLHDVRIVGRWGVSQPRMFAVGNLAELAEKEPNNDVPEAQRIEVDTTVNGVISAGTDVDYVVFKGTRGQKIYAACMASSIDSRLNPLLELYDIRGRIVASARPLSETETSLRAELPADGDYHIRVASFTYQRGGPNHFYRLNVTTTQWVEMLLPPAVGPAGGTVTPVGPDGPLPAVAVKVAPEVYSQEIPRGFTYHAASRLRLPLFVPAEVGSGPLPPAILGVTALGIVPEKEPNDLPVSAQEVAPETDTFGTIGKRGDIDWYRFKLKKGQTVVLTPLGDAIGSLADLTLSVRLGAEGGDIVDLDDLPAGGPVPRLLTRHDDPPAYTMTAAADGEYFVRVGSRISETSWGARHYYRLQIAAPRPRFSAVALVGDLYRPTGLLVPRGGVGTLVAGVFRDDGFAGEVTIVAEGLPASVTAMPLVLAAGETSGRMVFQAQPQAPADPVVIRLVARGTINGQAVTRPVVPTGYVWPVSANNTNIVPPARAHQTLVLACVDPAPISLVAALDKPGIIQGDKGQLKVAVKRVVPEAKVPVNIQTIDLPANFVNNNQPVVVAPEAAEGILNITVPATMSPGPQVLMVRGQAAVPFAKDPMAKQKPATSNVVWAMPVVLQVLPKALATVALSAPQIPVKAGQSAELVVKVTRLHGFGGPFQVDVVVPPAAMGVQVGPGVCPPGATEFKVPVRALPDAKPGARNDIVVRLTGTWPGGQPIPVEIKFGVVVNP